MNFCQCLTHFTRLLFLNYVDGVTNIFSHLKNTYCNVYKQNRKCSKH